MKRKHEDMYMRIAEAVAESSTAIRLKVGSVAVKNNMVIGTGYNGLPTGLGGDCEDKIFSSHKYIKPNEEFPYTCDLHGKTARFKLVTKPEVRHSEANLLLNLAKSTESSQGAVVFCTHSCCKFCAQDLVDAGITKFYYKHAYRDTSGLEYLLNNGVEVEKL